MIAPPGNGGPLFTHPAAYPASPQLDDATRRLCAGAYLDEGFAYEVIQETTEDDFRAVPPSLGFDLEPVIRHSFRARRLLLNRDLLLSGILLTGLVLVPGMVIAWVSFAAAVLWWRQNRKRPVAERRFGVVVGLFAFAVAAFCCLSYLSPLLLLVTATDQGGTTGAYGYPNGYPDSSPTASLDSQLSGLFNAVLLLLLFLLPLALAAATVAVLIGSRISVFRALTRALAPGSTASPPNLPSGRISHRVAWIAGAQRGNVALHSKNPFLGCGRQVTLWSMALVLQGRPVPPNPSRPIPADEGDEGTAGRHERNGRFQRDAEFDLGAISAREMHSLVRQSVRRLSDESLPVNQRVPGVYVLDRVVADGERYQGDPLIDPRSATPLEMAVPQAMAAIIDHPQGGVRYYQQMLIGVDGRAVHLPDGRPVLPPQPQDIIVSAHLHIAVEGGKLYVEFLGTVLPPIRRKFNQVNRLRPDASPMLTRAMPEILWAWVDSVRAPLRALNYLRQMVASSSRSDSARRDVLQFRSYDHGARLSVRELGAEQWPVTFLQDLDAFKYIKLVEKTVLETALDYLDRQGVDTSEYRAQMTHIQNTQTIMTSPNFQGPVAFGTGAMAASL